MFACTCPSYFFGLLFYFHMVTVAALIINVCKHIIVTWICHVCTKTHRTGSIYNYIIRLYMYIERSMNIGPPSTNMWLQGDYFNKIIWNKGMRIHHSICTRPVVIGNSFFTMNPFKSSLFQLIWIFCNTMHEKISNGDVACKIGSWLYIGSGSADSSDYCDDENDDYSVS